MLRSLSTSTPPAECCLSPGLVVCCLRGRPRCLALLLAAGADPDASEAPPCVGRAGGFAPLRYACWGTTAGHVECAEMLLAAGAAVEAATAVGHTPLQGACFKGARGSASRSFLLSDTAESVARRQGHGELAAWLAQSRHWTTPLHHLDSLSLARTRQRNGPSTGAAPIRSSAAAALVVAAAEPWSPASHGLWPERLQRLAVELLTLGYLLAREAAGLFTLGCGAGRQPRALSDVWLEYVLPLAVCRDEAEARA
ncbi:hypothetical protein EMIHUDRAFT_217901 [Emiliania huxleyi CCMP1516]|uniref:Uncharacterized protein n=2 Tax=Emiliania huxleyi TaxID=2903 RepID=A0A0D3I9H8_EMIH1|nr:hypothetical protein EMIHUDRAFT_217901 [Emiliania huxleyi CCMP1516]EOD07913.1 hypothetical protein EMIHUDRAFT_217901 [Emiliania huxleyi CCMP1516]|eukprot:XP_005760342.1 hypothetical protein EMIHUDRAFT_217901 [Emiliania huxleyi CCMP1516]